MAASTGETSADPDAACTDEFSWCLITATRAFSEWAAASVTDLPGGPRGHLVLATLSRERPSSQLALAHRLGVDRTVMTYLLDELEQAGFVQRHPDPTDRRARQVLITPTGRTALADYSARLGAAEERLLAPLDPTESAAFRRMIERVARAAHAAPDAPTRDACTA